MNEEVEVMQIVFSDNDKHEEKDFDPKKEKPNCVMFLIHFKKQNITKDITYYTIDETRTLWGLIPCLIQHDPHHGWITELEEIAMKNQTYIFNHPLFVKAKNTYIEEEGNLLEQLNFIEYSQKWQKEQQLHI